MSDFFGLLALYGFIGFFFALSVEKGVPKRTRIKIGIFWIIIVPILLFSQITIFEDTSCLNEQSLSPSYSPALTQNEQKPLFSTPDTETLKSQDIGILHVDPAIQHVPDLKHSPPQDIRLVAQSVVVDQEGVAKVVPSAWINSNLK